MKALIIGVVVLALCGAGAGGYYLTRDSGGDDEFTITTAAAPTPVYEPAGSPGLDSFYPLDVQLTDFAMAASPAADPATPASADDMTSTPVQPDAAGRADTDQATVTMVGLGGLEDVGGPSGPAIQSGLYGGTVENTCDPERLITYLLDNPDKGRVWADVQGIPFAELPRYIRSLRATVLTVDTMVINHGYDEQGYAIPIVSTLEAGTAVLVDENGDVRTRCYCGNPITPYIPPYEPPRCLAYYAVVYAVPGKVEDKLQGVPRSVRATNQVTNRYNVDWVEVSWGTSTGWVRADEAKHRYCKPEIDYRCVASGSVASRPQTDDYIGSLDGTWVEIVAFDIEGWTLISFGGGTGWIPTSMIGVDEACQIDGGCISSNVGIWTRPGESGTRIAAPGQAVRVEFTGESVGAGNPTHEKVLVTSPAPSRFGYVRIIGATDLPDSSCTPTVRCSSYDVDAAVYADSTTDEEIGVLWWVSVNVLSGPTNGRYQIEFGGATAWVDAHDLRGTGCEPWIQCIEIYGSIYDPLPTDSGTRANPGGFIRASFSGRIAIDDTTTYAEFTAIDPVLSPSGPAWVETSQGFNTYDNANCQMPPACPPGYDWDSRGECVPPPCPDGQPRTQAGACPPPPCPDGERLVYGDGIDNECCPVASLSTGMAGCLPPPCPEQEQLTLSGECCPSDMVVTAGGVCVPPPCPESQQLDNTGECCPTGYALDSTRACVPCPEPTDYDVNGRCCPTGQYLTEQDFCIADPCPGGEPRNAAGQCPVPPTGPVCPPGQEVLADGTCRATPPRGCPPGQDLLADGSCRRTPPTCTSTETLVNNVCVPVTPECETGFQLVQGQCREIFCDEGYELRDDLCYPIQCRDDERLVGNECVPILVVCEEGYYLDGSQCLPIRCADDETLVGNECVPVLIVCEDGFYLDGSQCLPIRCADDETLVGNECVPVLIVCDDGYSLVGNECVPILCPSDQVVSGNQCVPIQCNTGETLAGGQCVPIQCNTGETLAGNQCVPIQCNTGETLAGNECVPIQCTFGETLVGNQCQPIQCGVNETLSGDQCVPIQCGVGAAPVNGQCQCMAGYVQGGNGCIPDCPGEDIWDGQNCVAPAASRSLAIEALTPALVGSSI